MGSAACGECCLVVILSSPSLSELSQAKERQRIVRGGGTVVMNRVNGELAVRPAVMACIEQTTSLLLSLQVRFLIDNLCAGAGIASVRRLHIQNEAGTATRAAVGATGEGADEVFACVAVAGPTPCNAAVSLWVPW